MVPADAVVAPLVRLERDNLLSVVLFGSYARGEQREGSDVDLLVVLKEAGPGYDRAAGLRWSLLEARVYVPASFLVMTSDELDADVPAFLLDIALDGKVLFDRGFIVDRLSRLRAHMADAGLTRERVGPGHFAWRWKRKPIGEWTFDWGGYRERAA